MHRRRQRAGRGKAHGRERGIAGQAPGDATASCAPTANPATSVDPAGDLGSKGRGAWAGKLARSAEKGRVRWHRGEGCFGGLWAQRGCFRAFPQRRS